MSSDKLSLSGFSVITYITKDGEKCTASKNNGIVTIQCNKNGVRKLPVSDFIKELAENLPKVDLLRTPSKDTVQFKGVQEKTVHNPIDTSVSDSKTNNKLRNITIGLGSLATAALVLTLVGKKGHLPSGAKKLLGGAQNDAVKIADEVTGTVKKVNTVVPTEVAAKDCEQIINKKAESFIGETKAIKKADDVTAQAPSSGSAALPKEKMVKPKVEKQIEQPIKEQNPQNQEIEETIARLEEDSKKRAERFKQKQDEILKEYDDIANIVIAESLMRDTGAKVAEKTANDVVSKDVDKILKQMAKDADKTSETVAKAEIPKPESAIDDIGEKLFGEKNELSKAVDEFGMPKESSVLDDIAQSHTTEFSHLDAMVDNVVLPEYENHLNNLANYGDDFGRYGDDLTHYGDDFANNVDDLFGMDDFSFGF